MKRFNGIKDYLAVLMRCKWWLILTFIASAAFATLLSTMLPKIYVSETMLQIQPREVTTDFVKDLIVGSTDQRLNAIEQLILSRTNLLKILSQFENDMAEYRILNDERKVQKLKKLIKIEFVSERIGEQLMPIANVRISYRDRNPALAQKITARLASLFIEQETKARETQVYGTTEFLTKEVDKVAAQLQQSEDRLKKLKERFRYELPSELETNLRTLDRLQMEKIGNIEALDRNMTMRLTLERQVSETPPTIARDATPRLGGAGASQNALIDTYKKKVQELKELRAKALETHPDVQSLRIEIDKLKAQIPAEDLAAAERADFQPPPPANVPNPAYQNLQAQLSQLKTEIEIRERERKSIEEDIARLNQRVQNTPGVEQEMAAILRANEDLTKQHDDLKSKLSQAKLSESLESMQKGGQFTIVDPANYPLDPATPSRKMFLLVGCFISLAMGIASAFVVGMLDQRVWTQPELERFLGAPVLIEIPKMTTVADLARERRLMLMRSSVVAACTVAYVGCLCYLYLTHSAVLRLLNPVIDAMMERMVRQ